MAITIIQKKINRTTDAGTDVHISINKRNARLLSLVFSVSKKALKQLRDPEALLIGYDPDKYWIYIIPASKADGYVLTDLSSTRKSMKIPFEMLPFAEICVGDYNLKLDTVEGKMYVDVLEK